MKKKPTNTVHTLRSQTPFMQINKSVLENKSYYLSMSQTKEVPLQTH